MSIRGANPCGCEAADAEPCPPARHTYLVLFACWHHLASSYLQIPSVGDFGVHCLFKAIIHLLFPLFPAIQSIVSIPFLRQLVL